MKFYGLFGEKLSHSLSPQLHKAIYDKAQIDAGYKLFPFHPAQIKEAVSAIRLLSMDGVNVTIPYKEKVGPHLDELSAIARSLGVVNTIQNKNGYLIGHNTDYDGLGLIFKRRDWSIQKHSFVILGTGGAAKMAIAYLLDHDAEKITVISRKERHTSTDPKITYTTYEHSKGIQADYLINTTPVGMFPDVNASPFLEEELSSFGCVIDLIYNPEQTRLLAAAKKQGKLTANGLDMLIGQAVRSVEIWEDLRISDQIIDELIHEFHQWKEG